MEYGRVKPSESTRITSKLVEILALAIVALLILSAMIALVIVKVVIVRNKPSPSSSSPSPSPSPLPSPKMEVLIRACQVTRYPDLCVKSLGQRYMSTQAMQDNNSYYDTDVLGHGEVLGNIVEVSQYVTLDKLQTALNYLMMEKKEFNQVKDSYQWSVHDDCVELMEDSVDLLTRSHSLLMMLLSSSSETMNGPFDQKDNQTQSDITDLMTWMTTLCTNQDTCTEGFEGISGAKDRTAQIIQELSQIVSNHLMLSSSAIKSDVVPGRRLMGHEPTIMDHKKLDGPRWISKDNMELLSSSVNNMRPNITVSQDGNGPDASVRTIKEAIKKAPKNSRTSFIIYVKAGRYHEANLKVAKSKTNLWFIGDGKGKTIITGRKSVVASRVTTSKTPTFWTAGVGFVARGITFENTAGPENHQAVALFVKSDQAVVYDCEIKGYQDTLYVHSNRQFYRNCDIYGTVDSIFGNAQALLQNCTIYSDKPMEQQTNTITAQKKSQTCPDMCSGISIHQCRILATPELQQVKAKYSTYLGRPWRELSTVMYMLSYIGDHVNPQGWLPWNSTSLLDKVYYGEFQNHGPGANTSQRINAPGIHVNMSAADAARFTVENFIGESWIAQTNVPYIAGF